MPDLFHFRFFCVLAVEIAAFSLVAMRYERSMRKLAPVSIAAIAFGMGGLCLSLFQLCLSWISIKAALWITVHDWFSTSYPALERDFLAALILFVYILRGAKPAGKGWSAMLRAWGKELLHRSSQASGVVLLVVIVFSIGVFLYNLHKSCQTFVAHRPSLELTWTKQTSGFELSGTPQPDLTPEYLRDRQQYIILITYPKAYLVPIKASILFQFPYPVDQWKVNWTTGVSGAFFGVNLSPMPLVARGNMQFYGQQQYRHWERPGDRSRRNR